MDNVANAQTFLTALADAGVHGVICGGYARDTVLERDIRDIDLYVQDNDFEETVRFLQPKACPIPASQSEGAEYIHQSVRRQAEYTATVQYDLPTQIVNVIGLADTFVNVRSVIGRFNLGLCKIGIDLTELVRSQEFNIDADEEAFTLYRADWGYESTLKQWIRLQAKYPWPLRLPYGYDREPEITYRPV